MKSELIHSLPGNHFVGVNKVVFHNFIAPLRMLPTPTELRISAWGCRSKTEATPGHRNGNSPTPKVLCPCPPHRTAWTQPRLGLGYAGCRSPGVASAPLRQPRAGIRIPIRDKEPSDAAKNQPVHNIRLQPNETPNSKPTPSTAIQETIFLTPGKWFSVVFKKQEFNRR